MDNKFKQNYKLGSKLYDLFAYVVAIVTYQFHCVIVSADLVILAQSVNSQLDKVTN
jgi:hypothetical protein